VNTDDRQQAREQGRAIPLSRLRRYVLLGILALFFLQYAGIKLLVGGLSGSVALWSVSLLDIFAFLESLAAARGLTLAALWAVLPVVALYLVVGRAFCGWVCPMDFLFAAVDRIRNGKRRKAPAAWKPWAGYAVAAGLLIISALMGIPFFTNYLSHLTNFFRTLTGSVFLVKGFPAEPAVVACSFLGIAALLVLEYFSPRLWCRILCPVGKTNGLFNRVSLLRLRSGGGECAGCNLCDRTCYMGVRIARHGEGTTELRDPNCIYCGRCLGDCRAKRRRIQMTLGGDK